MQEGAGVRQIVEDALRRRGIRLRDLDVRLELGLQESVRRAVQAGYGVTFISRTAVESELEAGTLTEARVQGLEATREISLAVAAGRARSRVADAFVEFAATAAGLVIVRWGLEEVGPLLAELGSSRPLLVTSERLADLDVPVVEPVHGRSPARSGRDGRGGDGSAREARTCSSRRAAAARSTRRRPCPPRPSSRSWPSRRRMQAPSGRCRSACATRRAGASAAAPARRIAGIVYEPRLTLDLPLAETVGTAMNALAHCAEALYAGPLEDATTGARLIARHLPAVVEDGQDLDERTVLLEGAMHAGRALGERGLFLGHAIAQALGGRYGLPHGAMNALSLPVALRFNEDAVPDAVSAFADALETDDAPRKVEELARLGGFERLRDFGVPEDDLPAVAEAVVERPGARANPRPITVDEAEALLRSIW